MGTVSLCYRPDASTEEAQLLRDRYQALRHRYMLGKCMLVKSDPLLKADVYGRSALTLLSYGFVEGELSSTGVVPDARMYFQRLFAAARLSALHLSFTFSSAVVGISAAPVDLPDNGLRVDKNLAQKLLERTRFSEFKTRNPAFLQDLLLCMRKHAVPPVGAEALIGGCGTLLMYLMESRSRSVVTGLVGSGSGNLLSVLLKSGLTYVNERLERVRSLQEEQGDAIMVDAEDGPPKTAFAKDGSDGPDRLKDILYFYLILFFRGFTRKHLTPQDLTSERVFPLGDLLRFLELAPERTFYGSIQELLRRLTTLAQKTTFQPLFRDNRVLERVSARLVREVATLEEVRVETSYFLQHYDVVGLSRAVAAAKQDIRKSLGEERDDSMRDRPVRRSRPNAGGVSPRDVWCQPGVMGVLDFHTPFLEVLAKNNTFLSGKNRRDAPFTLVRNEPYFVLNELFYKKQGTIELCLGILHRYGMDASGFEVRGNATQRLLQLLGEKIEYNPDGTGKQENEQSGQAIPRVVPAVVVPGAVSKSPGGAPPHTFSKAAAASSSAGGASAQPPSYSVGQQGQQQSNPFVFAPFGRSAADSEDVVMGGQSSAPQTPAQTPPIQSPRGINTAGSNASQHGGAANTGSVVAAASGEKAKQFEWHTMTLAERSKRTLLNAVRCILAGPYHRFAVWERVVHFLTRLFHEDPASIPGFEQNGLILDLLRSFGTKDLGVHALLDAPAMLVALHMQERGEALLQKKQSCKSLLKLCVDRDIYKSVCELDALDRKFMGTIMEEALGESVLQEVWRKRAGLEEAEVVTTKKPAALGKGPVGDERLVWEEVVTAWSLGVDGDVALGPLGAALGAAAPPSGLGGAAPGPGGSSSAVDMSATESLVSYMQAVEDDDERAELYRRNPMYLEPVNASREAQLHSSMRVIGEAFDQMSRHRSTLVPKVLQWCLEILRDLLKEGQLYPAYSTNDPACDRTTHRLLDRFGNFCSFMERFLTSNETVQRWMTHRDSNGQQDDPAGLLSDIVMLPCFPPQVLSLLKGKHPVGRLFRRMCGSHGWLSPVSSPSDSSSWVGRLNFVAQHTQNPPLLAELMLANISKIDNILHLMIPVLLKEAKLSDNTFNSGTASQALLKSICSSVDLVAPLMKPLLLAYVRCLTSMALEELALEEGAAVYPGSEEADDVDMLGASVAEPRNRTQRKLWLHAKIYALHQRSKKRRRELYVPPKPWLKEDVFVSAADLLKTEIAKAERADPKSTGDVCLKTTSSHLRGGEPPVEITKASAHVGADREIPFKFEPPVREPSTCSSNDDFTALLRMERLLENLSIFFQLVCRIANTPVKRQRHFLAPEARVMTLYVMKMLRDLYDVDPWAIEVRRGPRSLRRGCPGR